MQRPFQVCFPPGSSRAQLESALVRADARQAYLLQIRRREKRLMSAGENHAEGLCHYLPLPRLRQSTRESLVLNLTCFF